MAPINSASGDVRDRVGFCIDAKDTADALSRVREAEAAGLRQVWMTMSSAGAVDPLTFFALAAMQTERVRFGTSIIPVFPRHPVVTAQQALAVHDVAPGRLRLGLGPSHVHIIEGKYGLRMEAPLTYLREYLTVLRSALWEGQVDFHGRFLNVSFSFPRKARIPLLVSALGEKAFRLAGEVSDGAISWMCPVSYLVGKALPALEAGARSCHRDPPHLVAQVPVLMGTDAIAVRRAARNRLKTYVAMPFYANMFSHAGLPPPTDESGMDTLVDALVVTGDEATVRQRLLEILASGLNELLITLIPVADEKDERKRLLRTIGSL